MSSQHIKDQAPPILDFSAFKDSDKTARAILVQQIQDACRDKGFFQITNHGITPELQEKVFAATKALFALPMEEKLKVQRSTSSPYRGYTGVGTQRFEAAAADTKESFYLGREAGTDQKLAGKPQWAPNIWPEAFGEDFKNSCSEYHKQIFNLAVCVLEAIGAGLGLEASYFKPYITDPVTVLRLIHYPPTPPTDHIARGIGAHRDFGGVTLLMQDEVGGLQVQNEQTGEWIDVEPVPNAYVVNLGNLMMRWANHRYTSNIHRVINTSARDRYSVPFFLAGNQDYVFDCLPGCEDKVEGGLKTKYQPISVGAYIAEQAKASYGEVKS